MANAPEMLVLGAGGILGEAWLSGLLAGLEEEGAFDACDCGGYLGTSAGSIVAAALAAGVGPAARLGRLPEQPPVEDGGDGSPPGGLNRMLAAASAVGS